MRKVKIASRLFDPLGYIEFTPDAVFGGTTYARRASQTPTLDGGSAFVDRGFSHSDRQVSYTYKPISKDHDDRAQRLVRLHETVAVASLDGLFEAVPLSFEPSEEENTFTLLIKSDLTESA